MIHKFWPHAEYDFKRNPDLLSKYSNVALADYGNWFFGAYAAELGLTEHEALAGAGALQRLKDFIDEKNDNTYLEFGVFLEGLIDSIENGTGDTPEDIEQIEGGRDYQEGPFTDDPNKDTSVVSCENTQNSSPSSAGSSTPAAQGVYWSGSGVIYEAPAIFCPNCTITDLPDPGDDEES